MRALDLRKLLFSRKPAQILAMQRPLLIPFAAKLQRIGRLMVINSG